MKRPIKYPYAKRNRGSRVWALLYGCTKEVLGPAGAFANNLGSIGGRLRRLAVCILQRPLQPLRLALELVFYVAGSSSSRGAHRSRATSAREAQNDAHTDCGKRAMLGVVAEAEVQQRVAYVG